MAIKHYKKIYSICNNGALGTSIQVHLARETKKTYTDITYATIRAHKDKGAFNWIGYFRSMGRLLKENEYALFSNGYCVYMFGSDLERLKQTWSEITTPVNEEGFDFNSVTIDAMVAKLNNGEETETGD